MPRKVIIPSVLTYTVKGGNNFENSFQSNNLKLVCSLSCIDCSCVLKHPKCTPLCYFTLPFASMFSKSASCKGLCDHGDVSEEYSSTEGFIKANEIRNTNIL